MLGAALVLGLKLAFLATSGTVRVEGPEFQGGVVQLSAPFAVSASRRQPPRQRFRNAERKGAR